MPHYDWERVMGVPYMNQQLMRNLCEFIAVFEYQIEAYSTIQDIEQPIYEEQTNTLKSIRYDGYCWRYR